MGTDHHLVSLWESILKTLDQPSSAVSVSGIDFSKSFNRIDHTHCLNSLARLGASNEVLGMHKAFLTGRKMSVRVGQASSVLRDVFGGWVQGSLLGVMQHNVSLDGLDDDLPIESSKYVDDMSVLEGLSLENMEVGGLVHAPGSQEAFKIIKNRAESVNMKVNTNKPVSYTHLTLPTIYSV